MDFDLVIRLLNAGIITVGEARELIDIDGLKKAAEADKNRCSVHVRGF